MLGQHPQDILSINELASFSRVSRRTVERWLRMGLAATQVVPRGRVLIRRTDAEEFLTSKRQAVKPHLAALVDEMAAELGLRRS